MRGPRRQGEAGDDDRGDEPPGDGLEDPGDREVGGVAAGERGGDLDREGGDEGGPGGPDHDGERVDEALGGDALAVEGPADLAGGGKVVRERPADEVPQRPGHAGHQADEHAEGGEPFDETGEAGHLILARPWRFRPPKR